MSARRERFDRVPESVAAVRRFVRHAISDLPHELSESIVLMSSEVATNVVRHAGTDYDVEVRRDARCVEVRVTDCGAGQPSMHVPDIDDPTGRGILIVDTLSDSWGTDVDPRGVQKTVWFRVAVGTGGWAG
jgi:anti-sigma regulatory factor (Ser/Thr protein kinase)